MAELFATGAAIELVLALMAAEAATLIAIRRIWRVGPPLGEVAVFLFSGAALMLAIRAALLDAPWTEIAVFLMAAFAGHGVDLILRWRRTAQT